MNCTSSNAFARAVLLNLLVPVILGLFYLYLLFDLPMLLTATLPITLLSVAAMYPAMVALADRPAWRLTLLAAAAYLMGAAYFGLGVMAWQVWGAGVKHTNVHGYFTWCWAYGGALLPITLPLLWLAFAPTVRRAREARRPERRGFEVVPTPTEMGGGG